MSECLYLAHVHPGKQDHYNGMPVFGEKSLQTQTTSVSLTSAGEAEVVNRIVPGASGPTVE